MSDAKVSSNPTVEQVLEIVCPAIKYAKCNHKRDDGEWDYWRADSGLCWCNKCGMCLNGRYESASDFHERPRISLRCDHKKDGRWTFWTAGSGLCWCNKCGMCLNGDYERDDRFNGGY